MKVSIITPTWRRHDLLQKRCMPSVAAQTIPVEHVVVSDGPDPELRQLLIGHGVTYAEVPEHLDPGTCARAMNLGIEVASGEYVGECDDDNALRPEHAARLVAALDETGADFAYSQIVRHGLGDVIGSDPPRLGGIDGNAIVYRRDLPARAGHWWPTDGGPAPDWGLVEGWVRAGAKWVFLPGVTVDFYYWPGTVGWRNMHRRRP